MNAKVQPEILKVDQDRGGLWPGLQRLQEKSARARAAADADTSVATARDAYLKALQPLYAAEKSAGVNAPPAPGDPAAARTAYSKGIKAKVDARIVRVKSVGDRVEVRFARGPEADPQAWKDEVVGILEADIVLVEGSVVTIEGVFTPGQTPAWRIQAATPVK